MKVIKPSYEVIYSNESGLEIMQAIERAGRVCYKSEDKITEDSCYKFIDRIIKSGHESVLEHKAITVKFIHNRGFTHELVRHRFASFSQESTRYVKYDGDMEFIEPYWKNDFIGAYVFWEKLMQDIEDEYQSFLKDGLPLQAARGILPNDLKTEINITANLREWRTIFKLRCAKGAHPDMQKIMIPLRNELSEFLPGVFV
jgi:thymidylate synthase (FAD)